MITKSTTTSSLGQPTEVNNNINKRLSKPDHILIKSDIIIASSAKLVSSDDGSSCSYSDDPDHDQSVANSDSHTDSDHDGLDGDGRPSHHSLDQDLDDLSVGGGGKNGVEVTGLEQWLCVSRLPCDLTEVEFYDLLAEFGAVKHYFLVFSDETGNVFQNSFELFIFWI